MQSLEFFRHRIASDLTPFCDPGTELVLREEGKRFTAEWQQRRRPQAAEFVVVEPGEILVRTASQEMSYRSFFASESMSDILGIAKTSAAIHSNPRYVETKARASDLDATSTEAQSAVAVLNKVVREGERTLGTDFVMVTGEAGAGKTWVLKELVRRQAVAFCEGSASFVYLYVDAQGRALAKFHEALSTELNELRVNLPYHAMAAMVRLGLIVPVVDGFDELIGVGGYDDAFSSISNFVDELEGTGVMVASARSTYYEQEFLARANRRSEDGGRSWQLRSAKVLAWSESERHQYVDSVASDPAEAAALNQKLSQVFSGDNVDLATKPLFLTRVVALLKSGQELTGDGTLTARLVDAFINRELKQKLLDRTGAQILTFAQLQSLCEDMAEEMWSQSTRELDRGTVKYVTDMQLSDGEISSASKAIVVERMPQMAFFKPGDSTGSIKFEHELFFDFFLAHRFALRLESKDAVSTVLLGRSAMPDSLSEEVAKHIFRDGRNLDTQLSVLSAASKTSGLRQGQVRENCGRLFGSLAQEFSRHDQVVENFTADAFVFPGSDLSGINFSKGVFRECDFRRVNLANSRLISCVFDGCVLEAPLVSPKSHFEVSGLDANSDLVGLRAVDDAGVIRTVYDPFEIRNMLKVIGLGSPEPETESRRLVDPGAIKAVDKIARAFARSNPICFEDFLDGSLITPKYWDDIRKAAIAAGMLKPEFRSAHGPKHEFLRRTVRAEDIMLGLDKSISVPDAVSAFWQEVEARFPVAN